MASHPSRAKWFLIVIGIVGGLGIASAPSLRAADEIAANERFELGDGVAPPAAGIADVAGDLFLAGPDWSDLFDAEGRLRDDLDEFGQAGSNGVPDILDTWGTFRVRRDATFVADDVSAGTRVDSSMIAETGTIGSGLVDAVHDLGNAYAYVTYDEELHLVLYAGLERLTTGATRVEIEFNQQRAYALPDGSLAVDRTTRDLRVVAVFGTALLSAEFQSWSPDPDTGEPTWLTRASLDGEDCSGDWAACAFCNGAKVAGGAWPSFGPSGEPVAELAPGALLEVGADLGLLLNEDTLDITFRTLRLTTPQDFAAADLARSAARSEGGAQ